jgi:hypothetical protein
VTNEHISTACGTFVCPVPVGKRRRKRNGIERVIPINAGTLGLKVSDIHPESGQMKNGGTAIAK